MKPLTRGTASMCLCAYAEAEQSARSQYARMENCTGFRDTGVLESRAFLQDVYPTEDVCGGQ